MGGVIGELAGAPYAASQAGSFYQNAANQLATEYGSPAAQLFSKEQAAALRPQFAQEQQQLTGTLAAQGIGPSGAGRSAMGNLGSGQAAAMASAVAPLYQEALQGYSNIIGQMPGAQNSAYQSAVSDFMNTVQQAGMMAAGMPPTGGGSTGMNAPIVAGGAAAQPGGVYSPGGYGQVGYYG